MYNYISCIPSIAIIQIVPSPPGPTTEPSCGVLYILGFQSQPGNSIEEFFEWVFCLEIEFAPDKLYFDSATGYHVRHLR